jgi:hypothetical protein
MGFSHSFLVKMSLGSFFKAQMKNPIVGGLYHGFGVLEWGYK